jgi:ATP-dependent RNA helicase MSS116
MCVCMFSHNVLIRHHHLLAKFSLSFFSLCVQVDVLVATPGRLIDHLENKQADLAQKLQGLSCLVLDEADRLLDMGFRPSLSIILRHCPAHRQTLLFSATLPAQVQDMCALALRAPYKFVNCVAEAEDQTVNRVTQHVCVVPSAGHMDAVLAIVTAHQRQQAAARKGAKIILFFTTARLTQFFASVFQEEGVKQALSNLPAFEIHSRKSQGARNKASDAFRVHGV